MALNLRTEQNIDYIAATNELLVMHERTIIKTIKNAIICSLEAVSNNQHHTAQDFWEAQGANGETVLNELKFWINALVTKAPEELDQTILEAGSTLIVANGVVTVPSV